MQTNTTNLSDAIRKILGQSDSSILNVADDAVVPRASAHDLVRNAAATSVTAPTGAKIADALASES